MHRTRTIAALIALVTATLVLDASPAYAAKFCLGKKATKVGTAGNNTIRGTARADVIWAGGGRDTVEGRGGADVICGVGGGDTLKGGGGNDRIDGGRGTDTANGGRGTDTCTTAEKKTSCEKPTTGGGGGGGGTPTGSDLAVTAMDGPEVLSPSGGGPVPATVVINVKNNGPQTANNITVRSTGLENQTGVVYASSPSGHSCFVVDNGVNCQVTALDTGFSSTAQVTITYNVDCTAPTSLTHTATISFGGSDPNAANNSMTSGAMTVSKASCP